MKVILRSTDLSYVQSAQIALDVVNLPEFLYGAVIASAVISIYNWMRARTAVDRSIRVRRARRWSAATLAFVVAAVILYVYLGRGA